MTLVNWNAMSGSIALYVRYAQRLLREPRRQPPTGIKPYTTWISNVIYQSQANYSP
ncbi:hypothetical protein H8E77_32905 [bacterium]|nr:hypothetical protein [bacterium]